MHAALILASLCLLPGLENSSMHPVMSRPVEFVEGWIHADKLLGTKRSMAPITFLKGPRSFQSYSSPAEFCSDLGLRVCIKLHGLWKEWPLYSRKSDSCRSQSWSHPEMALHNSSRLRPLGITWPNFNNLSIGISFHFLSMFFHLFTQNLGASVFQAFCSALGTQWSVSLEFRFTEDMALETHRNRSKYENTEGGKA